MSNGNYAPTPALKQFAERLLASRIDGEISQRELSKKIEYVDHFDRQIKLSAAYISRLESADRYPSVDAVFALADALSVERLWLLTGEYD